MFASGIFGEAQRSPWGAWTLQRPADPIDGITGSMVNLGRQMGSFSYLTSISFVPHTALQMFGPGIIEKEEIVSSQTLFWLAHGFLPTNTIIEDKEVAICLENPTASPIANMYTTRTFPIKDFSFFSLRHDSSGSEIPISMGDTMKCLGVLQPRIERFLPTASPPAAQLTCLKIAVEEYEERRGTQIVEGWVRVLDKESLREERRKWFLMKDIERTVLAFLRVEWDEWGFLVWQGHCDFWVVLLKGTTSVLRKAGALERLERFLGEEGMDQAKRTSSSLIWRVSKMFFPEKTRGLCVLGEHLKRALDGTEARPLRVSLAALFVLDTSFRSLVESLFVALTEPEGPDQEAKTKEKKQRTKKKANRQRRGIEKLFSHLTPLQVKEATQRSGKGPERPLGAEELEQNAATSETPTLPSDIGSFTYYYDAKELQWQPGPAATRTRRLKANGAWTVSGDLSRAPGAEKVVTLSPRDMVVIGLWAANHAAIWLSSQDSKSLLRFVDKLDTHVYVL
jgi:hypothetical protein